MARVTNNRDRRENNAAIQNIYKFLRTSTQGRGFLIDNSTRNMSSRNSMNWESSCARWKSQQAPCHKEHVGGHRQCSTYRATWPTEVHPHIRRARGQSSRELLPSGQHQATGSTVCIVPRPHIRTSWCLTEVLIGHLVQNLATLNTTRSSQG